MPEKVISRNWRRPSFAGADPDGRAYGNAIHAAMQYIRYENCGSTESIGREISRLRQEGFLSQEQADMVDCEKIALFFETDIGRKLSNGHTCLREFKFSILDEGSHYSPELTGEQVLLQGVVDCALLEPDGITILDFKTDRVTEETIANAAGRYRPQLETYAEALERIYEQPIKGKLLYFFRMNRFFEV